MNYYTGLIKHLEILKNRYEVTITIKDYVGLLECDSDLFKALEEYYVHRTSYCMYIKKDRKLWGYCLNNKDLIYMKLLREPKSFIGTCYAGIMEYVVPIIKNNVIIASIHIGEFKISKDKREALFKKLGRRFKKDSLLLKKYYLESTRSILLQLTMLEEELQIIIDYIVLIYDKMELEIKKKVTLGEIDKSYILSHAIEYIKQNFKMQLQLEDVSRFCHCSKSYLSHQFKRQMGMTIKSYINLLRVQEAIKILEVYNGNITQLAYNLGFKDSNYFSKVFKDFAGISPSHYRKEIKKDESI